MKPILFGIWFIAILGVYLGVPYEVWHHIPYAGFWQGAVMIFGTCVYEYFAFIFGLFIFGSSLAIINALD